MDGSNIVASKGLKRVTDECQHLNLDHDNHSDPYQ